MKDIKNKIKLLKNRRSISPNELLLLLRLNNIIKEFLII